jgi:hypothetical protein
MLEESLIANQDSDLLALIKDGDLTNHTCTVEFGGDLEMASPFLELMSFL